MTAFQGDSDKSEAVWDTPDMSEVTSIVIRSVGYLSMTPPRGISGYHSVSKHHCTARRVKERGMCVNGYQRPSDFSENGNDLQPIEKPKEGLLFDCVLQSHRLAETVAKVAHFAITTDTNGCA